MIDTHCHIIPKFDFNDPKSTIRNAQNAGVNKMICIGCDFEDIDETFAVAEQFPTIVYTAIGLHPETVKEDTDIDKHWNQFYEIFERFEDKIFAIGECGLDYHYSDNKKIHLKQIELFKRHIELSIDRNKPLIIHTRDAWDDTFRLFDELDVKNKKVSHHVIEDENNEFPNMNIDLTCGIIHSFTGSTIEAKKSIERNFRIGVNGIVTFKNKTLDSLREAIIFAGKENIVFETDSPFLTPEPFRGKTNEPARIKEITEFVEKLIS